MLRVSHFGWRLSYWWINPYTKGQRTRDYTHSWEAWQTTDPGNSITYRVPGMIWRTGDLDIFSSPHHNLEFQVWHLSLRTHLNYENGMQTEWLPWGMKQDIHNLEQGNIDANINPYSHSTLKHYGRHDLHEKSKPHQCCSSQDCRIELEPTQYLIS